MRTANPYLSVLETFCSLLARRWHQTPVGDVVAQRWSSRSRSARRPEGSRPLAKKSVYGTRDAPRGFWKGLHDTLLQEGVLPVPYETSACYVLEKKGEMAGLLGCHVDDLLWAGPEEMQEIMLRVLRCTSLDWWKVTS